MHVLLKLLSRTCFSSQTMCIGYIGSYAWSDYNNFENQKLLILFSRLSILDQKYYNYYRMVSYIAFTLMTFNCQSHLTQYYNVNHPIMYVRDQQCTFTFLVQLQLFQHLPISILWWCFSDVGHFVLNNGSVLNICCDIPSSIKFCLTEKVIWLEPYRTGITAKKKYAVN